MKRSFEPLCVISKKISNFLTLLAHGNFSPIKYRILTIEKDGDDDYLATVQIVNKKDVFKIKPEEILANDRLTDAFSPRDIRSLTYLGYLSINSPKYKILAQRLSENDQKLFFAIKEKGQKKALMKSADEISVDEEFLKSLDQKDAHMVGFVAATQQSDKERMIKETLVKNLQKSPDNTPISKS